MASVRGALATLSVNKALAIQQQRHQSSLTVLANFTALSPVVGLLFQLSECRVCSVFASPLQLLKHRHEQFRPRRVRRQERTLQNRPQQMNPREAKRVGRERPVQRQRGQSGHGEPSADPHLHVQS